jgi:hypothetical protein
MEKLRQVSPDQVVAENAAGDDSLGLGGQTRGQVARPQHVDHVIPGDCAEQSREVVDASGPFVLLVDEVGLDDHAATREEFARLARCHGLGLGPPEHLFQADLKQGTIPGRDPFSLLVT